jgi:hypothetical protein
MTMSFTRPGPAFFVVLALLQFFVVADGLVSWFGLDWTVAVQCAALAGLVPLLAAIPPERRRYETP